MCYTSSTCTVNRNCARLYPIGISTPGKISVKAHFDPLVWDRQRARELFDFDYTIECYTPAPKRHYGYFTLPILHRGRLIGRLDPKAHRAQGIFEIKTLAQYLRCFLAHPPHLAHLSI